LITAPFYGIYGTFTQIMGRNGTVFENMGFMGFMGRLGRLLLRSCTLNNGAELDMLLEEAWFSWECPNLDCFVLSIFLDNCMCLAERECEITLGNPWQSTLKSLWHSIQLAMYMLSIFCLHQLPITSPLSSLFSNQLLLKVVLWRGIVTATSYLEKTNSAIEPHSIINTGRKFD